MTSSRRLLDRHIVFIGRKVGHEWNAGRIRQKLLAGAINIAAEAERLTEEEFGSEDPCPDGDEDMRVDWHYRNQLRDDYEYMLEETESYLWGLGIAGVYHQWERDIRAVIVDLSQNTTTLSSVKNANFEKICTFIAILNFNIRQHTNFEDLNFGRHIANTIKHGDEKSFDFLIENCRQLFPTPRTVGRPSPDDLRVGVAEFDRVVGAVSLIWPDLEDALTPP